MLAAPVCIPPRFLNSESVAILYGEKKRQSMGLPDILIVATVDKELNG